MEPLSLCWILEYACFKKTDTVIQHLYQEFEELRKNTVSGEGHYRCLYNTRARLLVRALKRKLEQEDNPQVTEHDLKVIAELFYEYGSPLHPLQRTAEFTVCLERQTYMHFVHRLLTTEDLNQEEELFQNLLDHQKTMKKRYRARVRTGKRKKYPESEANLVEFAKALAPLEKQLHADFERIIPLHGTDNDGWHKELTGLAEDWPVASFKEEVLSVLEMLEGRLPPTVLETVQNIWRDEYAEGVDQETLEKDIRAHLNPRGGSPSPAAEPEPDPVPEPEPEEEEPEPEPAPRPKGRSRSGRKAQRAALSPQATSNDTLVDNPPEEEEEARGSRVDPIAIPSPEPLSQPSTQDLYRTPEVAAELRTSLQQLARLQGSDPINRAQAEGQAARKRSRPNAAVPPKKARRSESSPERSREFVVRWNSDSESEDESEDGPGLLTPEFRPPHPVRPLVRETAPQRREPVREPQSSPARPAPPRTRRTSRRWQETEVNWLISGIREYGVGNWKAILNRYPFENRTGVDLKDKYRNLLKHLTPEQILSGQR